MATTLKLAIIDTESTGLDPAQHELIGLGITTVRVNLATGSLLAYAGSYAGWREPASMSGDAERAVGRTRESLAGCRLDKDRIDTLIGGCTAVVAHNAAFDRPFVVPHVPCLNGMPWLCSMRGIDWRGTEGFERASLAYLINVLGVPSSDGSPGQDAAAIAMVLAAVLPATRRTGFAALLAGARDSRGWS